MLLQLELFSLSNTSPDLLDRCWSFFWKMWDFYLKLKLINGQPAKRSSLRPKAGVDGWSGWAARDTYQICCNDESIDILNHVQPGEGGRANQARKICVKQECEFFLPFSVCFFLEPRQITNDYIGAWNYSLRRQWGHSGFASILRTATSWVEDNYFEPFLHNQHRYHNFALISTETDDDDPSIAEWHWPRSILLFSVFDFCRTHGMDNQGQANRRWKMTINPYNYDFTTYIYPCFALTALFFVLYPTWLQALKGGTKLMRFRGGSNHWIAYRLWSSEVKLGFWRVNGSFYFHNGLNYGICKQDENGK